MADDQVDVKLSLKGRKQFSSEADRAAKDIDKVSKAAKRANQSTREASAGVGSLGSQFSGIASIGRKVAGVGLAMGTAAGAAGIFGLRTVSALEQADIAFTTMLGSAEKSKVFLDELKAFAAKTPFEFPELQSAASSLISAGIESKKVIPIMNSLGNATSGMGTGAEGVKRATIALQQMNAAGRITGEDLNQLRDAGIPVFDLLAAATGKSKEEVAGLAQKGKLAKKELDQLMTALETGKGLERFNGLMDKQSRSLGGLFSTLKDAANMGLATALMPVGDQLRDVMPSAITATTRAAEWLGQKLGLLAGKLKEMRDNGTLGRMWEKAKEVGEDLATIWTQSLWPAIQDLTSALGGKEGVLGPLGAVLAILSWMADHPTAGQLIFEGMAIAITSWKLAELITGVTTSVNGLKLAMAAPTGLLGVVIALPIALGVLYTKLDEGNSFWTGFGAALGPQVGMLFTMRGVLKDVAEFLGIIEKKKNVVEGVNVGPWASGYGSQNSQQGGGQIGAMATGGIVRSAGLSLVGERGPELLTLPTGSRVDPLPDDGGGLELGPSVVIEAGAIQVATSDPRLAAKLVVQGIQNRDGPQMSKITITPLSFPNAALTLPLGKKKPLFSDGTGQWNTVPRPRRRAMTEFEGEAPLKYAFDICLNAFPDGNVEPLIRRIVGWAARNDLPYQPTLVRVSGPIVYPDVTYYLSKCDQLEESMEFNSAGRICRQFLDLEITEYVAPDLVIQTPPPAQAAQKRAAETKPAERTYTVSSGDTLWSIATRLLGKGQRWGEIATLNNVRDPKALQIGQVLKVPAQ